MTTLSPDASPASTTTTSTTTTSTTLTSTATAASTLRRLPGLSGLRTLRDALDRPLSSYYLLLGASTLLLTIGLMMVLSSSSVDAYKTTGDSYAIVKRQLMWVLMGLPCAFIASRMSPRWIRRMAWPAYLLSLSLLLLTAFLGVERNGNQNWLAVGPLAIQPSEVAKLGLVLWAANIYAHKERRLARVHEIMIPVVPGMLMATGLVIAGRDLGTALVLFAILLGMLWVVGAPPRLLRDEHLGHRRRGHLHGRDGHRAAPADHQLLRPVQGLPRHRVAARPRSVRAVQRAAGSARASAPPRRSGAACRRRTTTSSSPCSARSSAWSAPCS